MSNFFKFSKVKNTCFDLVNNILTSDVFYTTIQDLFKYFYSSNRILIRFFGSDLGFLEFHAWA